MRTAQKVILLGSISIDRIMNFHGHYRELIQPDKLHVLSLSVLLDNLRHTRGGVAANIAYNLALLGDHPHLLTSAGSDAADYLKDLDELGIDISHIHMSDAPTATFTVMTDLDDNQIGGFYPGAMADSGTLSLTPWASGKALVMISAYDPSTMSRLLTEAKSAGHTIIYDIGQQVSNVAADDLVTGIENADILFVNDYEMGILAKRTGLSEKTITDKVPIVITTLGAKGSQISGRQVPSLISIPAITNINVVDPTGAGDAYRAGFLYGYTRGWDLTMCGKMGSVTASFAVEKIGTQEHKYTLKIVKNRYQSMYKESL